jgi:hypothetical protein
MRRNAVEIILEEAQGLHRLVRMPIMIHEEGTVMPLMAMQGEWCQENCKGAYAPHFDPQEGFQFLFVDPDDAFAYRMRWQ